MPYSNTLKRSSTAKGTDLTASGSALIGSTTPVGNPKSLPTNSEAQAVINNAMPCAAAGGATIPVAGCKANGRRSSNKQQVAASADRIRQPHTHQGNDRHMRSSTAAAAMQQTAVVCGRVQPRVRRWNSSGSTPAQLSFVEAVKVWQLEVEAGGYCPRFLGSLAAVSTGQVGAATMQQSRIAGSKRGAVISGRGSVRGSAADSGLTALPAVFEGTGDDAVQALEALVLHKVVQKPCLTVMQLQQSIQAISQLDSPFQLAAISVLLQAGFWMAAMQVGTITGHYCLQTNGITMKRPVLHMSAGGCRPAL